MTMQKISISEVKRIAKEYGLTPCRAPQTKWIQIRKHENSKLEDISWYEFEKTLKERGLAIYKTENSVFLKIMKDK